MTKKLTSSALLCCAILGATSAQAALSISLNFNDAGANYSALNNDAWNGGTSDAEKRAAFESAVQAAADRWEYAFAASTVNLSYTVDVTWGARSSLASGGPSIIGSTIVGGSLIWDNDGSSSFYVDTDTSTTDEWGKSSFRSLDLGAGDVNVERVYYDAPNNTAAQDHHDLYTVALHELGHTLGFINGYTPYNDLDVGNDGDLDLQDGSQLAYDGGHSDISIATPEYTNPDPFLFPHDGSSIGATYNPTLLADSVVAGIRKDISAVDIIAVASIHGFDNVNTAMIPEPSSSALLGLSGLAFILRRKR